MRDLERFFEFNDKRISILLSNGEWWVAIKPICEALNVHYKNQHEMILKDEILSQLSRQQGMVGADGRIRNMTCLPEEFIYGWLFSIRSDAPLLKEYKYECYRVLYKYFHGKMTERMNVLTEKIANIEEMEQLKATDVLEKYKYLESRNKKLDRMLKGMDTDLLTGQISFNLKPE